MTLTTQHFGVNIPVLGFGTWQLKGDDAHRCVKAALNAGYRHIDTAQAYENEQFVGRGLRDSGLKRNDYFLTTKVWTNAFHEGDLQESVRQSLSRLGVDDVDLLLLHWPNNDVPLEETIAALNDARDLGLTRHIGVSNFPSAQFDEVVKLSRAPILCNQVEYHPMIDQSVLLENANAHGSALTAYCPLAQGKVFQNETIRDIAEKHGKSPAQIVMRWFIQQPNVIAIPRSSSEAHIQSNNDIHDFALEPDDMARITELKSLNQRIVDPDFAPDWDMPLAA